MSRVGESIAGFAGLALAATVLAATLAGRPAPLLSDVLFGTLPFLFLSGAVTLFVLTSVCGERVQAASLAVMRLVPVALAFALIVALLPFWNDGSYYIALAPADALVSILTIGFLPFKTGPEAIIRFLPAAIAVGIRIRAKRIGRSAKKGIAAALIAYLAIACGVNALSWIAGVLGMSRGVAVANLEDANRVLVTSQADGYWTRGQVERFFAPLGQQSENSFAIIRASVAFLGACLFLLFVALREIRGIDRIAKRLTSRSVILLGAAMLISAAVGFSTRNAASYTDVLACLVFLVSAALWLAWWRLARDLENLPRDERERPELPLPSASASPNDVVLLRDASAAIALFGSLVLGWPVFAGFATAFVAYFIFVWAQRAVPLQDDRRVAIPWSITIVIIAASLGSSALSVALRDAPPAPWMLRLALSVGILIGAERLSRRLDHLVSSRVRQAATLLAATALAFLAADQRVLWLLFLPLVAAYFLIGSKQEKWTKQRAYPLYFTLCAIGFVALFVPHLFTP